MNDQKSSSPTTRKLPSTRVSQLSDQELDISIREIERIIMTGKDSAIQQLSMIKATDDSIIYELRQNNKWLMRLAIGGWGLSAVLLAWLMTVI